MTTSCAPNAPPKPPAVALHPDFLSLGPRANALLHTLGGWHRLPLTPEVDLSAIVGLCYPKSGIDPRGTGIYRADAHDAATLDIRRRVLAPLSLIPQPNKQVDLIYSIVDHAVAIGRRKKGKVPIAVWSSPYIDALGQLRDADPKADAADHAGQFASRLAGLRRRAIVLGVGSYHPGAVDLLIWPFDADALMRESFESTAPNLPTWSVTPAWW
jgi:hypothetical protein